MKMEAETKGFEEAKAVEAQEELKKKEEQAERDKKQMYMGDLVMKAILFVVGGHASNYEFPVILNGADGKKEKMIISVRKGK